MDKKIVVESGGDWADASYRLLNIDSTVVLKEEQTKYAHWYVHEYLPELRADKKPKFMTFDAWLVERCGAKYDTETEVIDGNL